MIIKNIEKVKENVKNQVNYYKEEGDKREYDSYLVAKISLPEHNDTLIEIIIVPNQFFDVLNNMSMATMISKGNPLIKKGIDENTILLHYRHIHKIVANRDIVPFPTFHYHYGGFYQIADS